MILLAVSSTLRTGSLSLSKPHGCGIFRDTTAETVPGAAGTTKRFGTLPPHSFPPSLALYNCSNFFLAVAINSLLYIIHIRLYATWASGLGLVYHLSTSLYEVQVRMRYIQRMLLQDTTNSLRTVQHSGKNIIYKVLCHRPTPPKYHLLAVALHGVSFHTVPACGGSWLGAFKTPRLQLSSLSHPFPLQLHPSSITFGGFVRPAAQCLASQE